jgi:hypothetical protein
MIAPHMSYQEKLTDPRWQRKRLEILQDRDWTCEECFDTTEELHVHHRVYFPHRDPWDYPDFCYCVLCKTCHEELRLDLESGVNRGADFIASFLKQYSKFHFNDSSLGLVSEGLHGFFYHAPTVAPPTFFDVFALAMSNEDIVELMFDHFLEHLDYSGCSALADFERRHIAEAEAKRPIPYQRTHWLHIADHVAPKGNLTVEGSHATDTLPKT